MRARFGIFESTSIKRSALMDRLPTMLSPLSPPAIETRSTSLRYIDHTRNACTSGSSERHVLLPRSPPRAQPHQLCSHGRVYTAAPAPVVVSASEALVLRTHHRLHYQNAWAKISSRSARAPFQGCPCFGCGRVILPTRARIVFSVPRISAPPFRSQA